MLMARKLCSTVCLTVCLSLIAAPRVYASPTDQQEKKLQKDLFIPCYRPQHFKDNALIKNASDLEDDDGRAQVQNPFCWPYAIHGVVQLVGEDPQMESWGSGTLIGPNIVLTAAQLLWDRKEEKKIPPENITFFPALRGSIHNVSDHQKSGVKQYFFPEAYKKDAPEGEREDYGVLILKRRLGKNFGYACLQCVNDTRALEKEVLNITGYPLDKKPDFNEYAMYTMCTTKSRPPIINNEQIECPINTDAGQGGGGVWYQDQKGEVFVVGVHVWGDLSSTATLINPKRYQQIQGWINPFQEDTQKLQSQIRTKIKTNNLQDIYKKHSYLYKPEWTILLNQGVNRLPLQNKKYLRGSILESEEREKLKKELEIIKTNNLQDIYKKHIYLYKPEWTISLNQGVNRLSFQNKKYLRGSIPKNNQRSGSLQIPKRPSSSSLESPYLLKDVFYNNKEDFSYEEYKKKD